MPRRRGSPTIAPAELRAFADGLCDARGVPQLAMTVNASCRSASFDGEKMLVEIPVGFGSGAVERRAVAHEVAHACRWVWGLDWPRKRRDRMISHAAYAAAGALVLAAVVGVVVDTFFGVDALAGVALLALVIVAPRWAWRRCGVTLRPAQMKRPPMPSPPNGVIRSSMQTSPG